MSLTTQSLPKCEWWQLNYTVLCSHPGGSHTCESTACHSLEFERQWKRRGLRENHLWPRQSSLSTSFPYWQGSAKNDTSCTLWKHNLQRHKLHDLIGTDSRGKHRISCDRLMPISINAFIHFRIRARLGQFWPIIVYISLHVAINWLMPFH